ncbi:MAG: hypothetical protein EXR86_14015 [Gammaproteobacteria bacterium]|nr:hypothetical protein [Gammaproteobacteria bacterium]
MTIVCLGWGSLIWRQEKLPVIEPWHDDGPKLPVEFARQSQGGQITLVIKDGLPASRVFWAALDVANLNDAREVLRVREKIQASSAEQNVAHWSRNDGSSRRSETGTIEMWAAQKPEIEAVVWTALPPKFDKENGRMPTEQEVVAYLQTLNGQQRDDAEKYVRCAPPRIRTPYRIAIERALDWIPLALESCCSSE